MPEFMKYIMAIIMVGLITMLIAAFVALSCMLTVNLVSVGYPPAVAVCLIVSGATIILVLGGLLAREIE